MENKKTLKIDRRHLLFIAAIIAILATFLMFCRAVHWKDGPIASAKNNPSFFELAFGYGAFEGNRKAGFTTIFVFQCIVIVLSLLIVLSYFNILLDEQIASILAIVSSLLSFVIMILSFCSISLCGYISGSALVPAEALLGFGAILFSCAHIIAIAINVFALIKR